MLCDLCMGLTSHEDLLLHWPSVRGRVVGLLSENFCCLTCTRYAVGDWLEMKSMGSMDGAAYQAP